MNTYEKVNTIIMNAMMTAQNIGVAVIAGQVSAEDAAKACSSLNSAAAKLVIEVINGTLTSKPSDN